MLAPVINWRLDSITGQLIFSDSIDWGYLFYWRFATSGEYVTATNESPVFNSLSDTITTVCLDVYDTLNYCTAQVCDNVNIFVDRTNSLRVLSEDIGISFRVSSGTIEIQYSKSELKAVAIYDLQGREVRFANIDESPAIVTLNQLANGLYLAKFIMNDKCTTAKFMYYK